MQYAAVYVISRFLYRVVDFFHHWYVDGSRFMLHRFVTALHGLDRTFALRVTLHHFKEPLYGDYSIIGRIVGIVFRTARIAVGGVVYACIAAMFLVVYAIWLLIPLLIISFIIKNADGAFRPLPY